MKRSLKLRIFIFVFLGIAIFVLASRLTIRFSASAPLVTYQSELFGRQITRISTSLGDKTGKEKLQTHLIYAIEGLKPHEFVVLPSQNPSDQIFSKELLAASDKNFDKWNFLDRQLEGVTVSYKDVEVNGIEWRLFKTKLPKNVDYLVALDKGVLKQRMFDTLDVRDRMGLQIYPILILYAVFLTFFISYAALEPFKNIQRLFSKIDIKNPVNRSNLKANDTYKELNSFINYFNELIDRSRFSYQHANRFSSDASHELKTPLTIIRGHLQRILNRSQDGSDDQIQLSLVIDEVERLISITNKLLMLSQADSGRLTKHQEMINFNELVDHLIEDYSAYRPDIEVKKNMQMGLQMLGDKELITQLMLNLFSNAYKYNFSGGQIIFDASCNPQQLTFTITNTTHLNTAGLDQRVFERFYRHLESNNLEINTQQGSGLGLSICQEIAKAHGGSLQLLPPINQKVSFKCYLDLKSGNLKNES